MKKIVFAFIMTIAAIGFIACSSDNNDDDNDNKETVANPETPTDGSKILVAYFSWGGNTRAVATRIAQLTGGHSTRFSQPPHTPLITKSWHTPWHATSLIPTHARL